MTYMQNLRPRNARPCPSCNGTLMRFNPVLNPEGESGWQVRCLKCWLSTGWYKSKAGALRAWNTRHDTTELVLRALERERREALELQESMRPGLKRGGQEAGV